MKAGVRLDGPNFEIGFVNIGGGIAQNVEAGYWVRGAKEFKREWGTAVHFSGDIHRLGFPLNDASVGVIGGSNEIRDELDGGDDTFAVEWSYENARGDLFKEYQEFSVFEQIEKRSESTGFYSDKDGNWPVEF